MSAFNFPKLIILSIICMLLHCDVIGQQRENTNPYASLPFKDRLFYGGDLGLSFGTITSVRIAPIIGYFVNKKLSVGIGPSYQYYSDSRYKPKFETSIVGGSVFGRYFILESIFVQTELEILNLDEVYYDVSDLSSRDRITIPVLLLGGGFSQRSPNGSGFFVGAFYDVIQDINSPYPDNIVLRLGGQISF